MIYQLKTQILQSQMVSADNLNLDVLQLIFDHITERDIVSVTLVSRSFFYGAVPRLYRNIVFKESHAKRYLKVCTPKKVCVMNADGFLALVYLTF